MRPQRPFPEKHVKELDEFMKVVQDAKEYRHAQCIQLRIRENMTAEEIAPIVGYHPNTVLRIWSIFFREGVEGLRRHPSKRCRAYLSLEEEKEVLDGFVEKATKGHITVVGEMKGAIEEKVGHSVHKSTVYRFLKRNNWRKVKPRPVHPKNDPEKVEAFKKELPVVLNEERQKAANIKRYVRLFFQDEARFGCISRLSSCWAPMGIRPSVPCHLVRKYLYVYGAVCPEDGALFSLILPETTTAAMNVFLGELSQAYPEDYLVVAMDRAPWHTSSSLTIPENMRLVWLPSYSPECNPAEHLWDMLRERYFCNRLFKSLDHVEKALMEALYDFWKNPSEIQSLTLFPWIQSSLRAVSF